MSLDHLFDDTDVEAVFMGLPLQAQVFIAGQEAELEQMEWLILRMRHRLIREFKGKYDEPEFQMAYSCITELLEGYREHNRSRQRIYEEFGLPNFPPEYEERAEDIAERAYAVLEQGARRLDD